MAGTWLDLDIPADLTRSATASVPDREKGGGRHWARTSDLLHVKQKAAQPATRGACSANVAGGI
jgi:hypothetical protein